jgi:hypothetical protein
MWRVLEYARDNHDLYTGVSGRSESGGRFKVVMALRKRGLIDTANLITDVGLAELESRRIGANPWS